MDSFGQTICLCGSTRFKAEFEAANQKFTLRGFIVLAPGVFGHADGIALTTEEKQKLDALHLMKIDEADHVHVINPGGYIGDSTRAEIAHAKRLGRRVTYLEAPPAPPANNLTEWDLY